MSQIHLEARHIMNVLVYGIGGISRKKQVRANIELH